MNRPRTAAVLGRINTGITADNNWLLFVNQLE